MKQIIIEEQENGQVTLKAVKGVKWTTFITGIEMLLESILEESETNYGIDDILDDVKRIYERDKNELTRRNKSNN